MKNLLRNNLKIIIQVIVSTSIVTGCNQLEERDYNRSEDCVKIGEIAVCYDTIRMSIPGVLTNAFVFNESYYLFFLDNRSTDSLGNMKGVEMYKVSKDGKEIVKLEYPEELSQATMLNTYIDHDSLFVYSGNERKVFSFNDQNYEWKESDTSKVFINHFVTRMNKNREKLISETETIFSLGEKFKLGNDVYQVYFESGITKIGRVENDELKQVYEFDSLFLSFEHVTDNNGQLFRFFTSKNQRLIDISSKQFGLLEITPQSKIHVHYIDNDF